MGEIYGAAWVNQYGENGGSGWETWCKALSHLSINDIAAGMDRLFTEMPKYPPNLPQFREMCIGNIAENIGLESEECAYVRLIDFACRLPPFGKQKDFSALTPAMYWLYKNINAYSWARMNEKDSRSAFASKYREAIRLAVAGYEFDHPPVQIESGDAQRERAHLEKLKDPAYAEKCRQACSEAIRKLRAEIVA